MALPSIFMPAGINGMLRDDSLRIRRAEQFGRTQFGSGHDRKRRIATAAERDADITTKRMEQTKALLFQEWYENVLKAGGLFFSLYLRNQGDVPSAELIWWKAAFRDPPKYTPDQGRWTISMRLRLVEFSATSPASGLSEVEFVVRLLGTASIIPGSEAAVEFFANLSQFRPAYVEFNAPLLQVVPFELLIGGGYKLKINSTPYQLRVV